MTTNTIGWHSSFEGFRRSELRQALKKADPVIFERVLQFLEDDPLTFGSGYAKVMMWQYIRRYDLDENHIRQLERSALKYLERPMRPEFKRMCQTMAQIGTKPFWQEVETFLNSQNPVEQVNAYCLHHYSKGLVAGEQKRLELKPIKREIRKREWERKNPRYGYSFWGESVFKAVTDPSIWKDNLVIYREPNQDDYPIMLRATHKELLEIDFSRCDPDKIISALNPILEKGTYSSATGAWLHVFYVFGELGNAQAIPVIEEFYARRVAYQFESATKWLTTQAVYRALRRIGTPEALEASKKYIHADPMNDEHMRSFTTGWLVNEKGENKPS
jgi:hypothetical protein